MTLQTGTEVILAVGAASLLARDIRRAWRDRLRRPITLLVAGVMTGLLIGGGGGRAHPHPWWLLLPTGILIWEVVRGWNRTPRCHLWETGAGTLAASLLLAALGLDSPGGGSSPVLLVPAICLGLVAVGLFWRSHRREPRPSRAGDMSHYERRSQPRPAH